MDNLVVIDTVEEDDAAHEKRYEPTDAISVKIHSLKFFVLDRLRTGWTRRRESSNAAGQRWEIGLVDLADVPSILCARTSGDSIPLSPRRDLSKCGQGLSDFPG